MMYLTTPNEHFNSLILLSYYFFYLYRDNMIQFNLTVLPDSDLYMKTSMISQPLSGDDMKYRINIYYDDKLNIICDSLTTITIQRTVRSPDWYRYKNVHTLS